MRSRVAGMTALLLSLPLLAACGTPQHSNTLIFATDTKVALDVSASPTNAGVPEITLGYKRVEAVWMPLLANTKGGSGDRMPGPCEADEGGCKFVGKAHDNGNPEEDTYSVLASFGSKFGGEGSAGSAKGTVAIAQYFATGIAAQKLAEKGGAALVNTNASAASDAEAAGVALAQSHKARSDAIVSYLAGQSEFKSALEKLATDAGVDDSQIAELKEINDLAELKEILEYGGFYSPAIDMYAHLQKQT